MEKAAPVVFVSYSWDSDGHCDWVEALATHLVDDGLDIRLDRWRDESITIDDFMMASLDDADIVLVICTPTLKEKVLANARGDQRTASGFEIGTAAAYRRTKGKIVVPVLVSGKWEDAAPPNLIADTYYNLSNNDKGEYIRLRERLLGYVRRGPKIGAQAQAQPRTPVANLFDTSNFSGSSEDRDLLPFSIDRREQKDVVSLAFDDAVEPFRNLGAKDAIDLRRLLVNVKSSWIRDKAKSSAKAALQITSKVQLDLIDYPWEGIRFGPDQKVETLTPEHGVLGVFVEARRLLVLGQPGSGKTTMLLELAEELVKRAETNIQDGVPVVLHLSSFRDVGQSFAEWLEDELLDKYQIPRKIGAQWIASDWLVLLLDGLDETKEEYRSACVDALHAFLEESLHQAVCVCCRTQEYDALDIQLKLRSALVLQPLTPEQISEFLDSGGPGTATVREILKQHEQLRDLAKSPLMLGMLCQAYRDVDPVWLREARFKNLAGYTEHLFSRYVDAMFERSSGPSPTFARADTIGWLSWLATKMGSGSGSSIFQIEALEPSWMETAADRLVYLALISVAMAMLSTLATSAFWYGAGFADSFIGESFREFPPSAALIFLLWHLAIALVDESLPKSNSRNAGRWRNSVQGATKVGIFFVIWCAIAIPLIQLANLGSGTFASLLFSGAIGAALYGAHARHMCCFTQIPGVETVGVSGRGARVGALYGAVLGIVLGLLFRLVWPEEPDVCFWFRDCTEGVRDGYFFYFLVFVTIGSVIGTVLGGRVPRVYDEKIEINQGTRLSIRHAWRSGLLLWSAVTTTVFVCFLTLNPAAGTFEKGLSLGDVVVFFIACGLAAGYCAAFWFGGFSAVKHYVLRLTLTLRGYLPLDVASLMNYASELAFMVKRGGGYTFMHRLLLDHFAARQPARQENLAQRKGTR